MPTVGSLSSSLCGQIQNQTMTQTIASHSQNIQNVMGWYVRFMFWYKYHTYDHLLLTTHTYSSDGDIWQCIQTAVACVCTKSNQNQFTSKYSPNVSVCLKIEFHARKSVLSSVAKNVATRATRHTIKEINKQEKGKEKEKEYEIIRCIRRQPIVTQRDRKE